MPKLYMITVPGLVVPRDWGAVHDRLLDDFPAVNDVLATTMPATVLIVYEGTAEVDAWLDGVGEAVLGRRLRAQADRADVRQSVRATEPHLTAC
jgi:hypothetical protein